MGADCEGLCADGYDGRLLDVSWLARVLWERVSAVSIADLHVVFLVGDLWRLCALRLSLLTTLIVCGWLTFVGGFVSSGVRRTGV